MAEIAIPILALGSFYILSNQDKDEKNKKNTNMNTKGNSCSKRENFQNIQQQQQQQPEYRNLNNEMKSKSNQMVGTNTVKLQQHTDKFFEQGNNIMNNMNTGYMSLTGDKIDMANFNHNNMTPFFGSKIRGATTDSHISESILDNMQGSGSQHRVKRENAPLFAPKTEMGWQNGAPNTTDF